MYRHFSLLLLTLALVNASCDQSHKAQKFYHGISIIDTYRFNCRYDTLVNEINRIYIENEYIAYPDSEDKTYQSIFPYGDLTLLLNNKVYIFTYHYYGDDTIQKYAGMSKISFCTLRTSSGAVVMTKKEEKYYSTLFMDSLVRKVKYFVPGKNQVDR